MIGILNQFFDITLARRGPEDLPTSARLLVVTTALYLLLFSLLSLVLGQPLGALLGPLLVSTAFSLLWVRLLLTLTTHPERFLQTATGIMAIGLVTVPIVVPLNLHLQRIMTEMSKLPSNTTPSGNSAVVILLALPITIWIIYAQARVLRAALELRLSQAVMLVIGGQLLELLLLGALFAAPAAAK